MLFVAIAVSSAYKLRSSKGIGHDTLMRGGEAARDYIMRRDGDIFNKREDCKNEIGTEECSEAFMTHGFSCNSLEFNFEKNCREYCEFCVPDRGDSKIF